MLELSTNPSARLLFAVLLGVCAASAPAQEPAPIPSAAAFDALLKRLELGDLSELDIARQRSYIAQLKQLLPIGDAHRQRLLDAQHCLLDFTNANQAGYDYADAKLAQALQANDDTAAVRFYYCRGGYRSALHTSREAMDDYNHGIDLARQSNDEMLLATGLEARGSVYSVLGVHGKALADLLEAQRLFNQYEAPIAANGTLQSIGTAYRRLGYPDKAREYLNQSIQHAQEVGDHSTLFISLMQLGYADDDAGNYDKALANEQQALQIANALDDRGNVGSAQLAIASALTSQRQWQDALDSLQKAQANFAAIDDASKLGMLQFERGRALSGLGQQRKALENFDRAEAAFDAEGNPRYQEMLHKAKAQSLEADGQAAAALAEYKRYLAVHDEVARARADEQAQMLRAQFDTDRANLENARLKTEQMATDRQVQSLQRVRRWQQTAMALLALVLGFLGLFVFRQLRKLRSWKRMASLDPLTGVANRRGLAQFANAAMRAARARDEPLSVLALDLDRFKQINDSYGHAAGDRVLQHIARACEDALREGDLLGRTGGEEFLVILPGSTREHAADVAERLRRRIEALSLEDLPAGLRTTISVGVAAMAPQDSGFADLEQRADEALYAAKAQGRNRVVGAAEENGNANQELGAAAGTAAAIGGRLAS